MGTFLLVNINYIPSFAYIDAGVHCNVPDIWNSALWACIHLRGTNGLHTMRISGYAGRGCSELLGKYGLARSSRRSWARVPFMGSIQRCDGATVQAREVEEARKQL